MARTPNYSFERKERERLKAEKKAARAAAKKKALEENSDPSGQNGDESVTPSSVDD